MVNKALFQLLLLTIPLIIAPFLYSPFEPFKEILLHLIVTLWGCLFLIEKIKKDTLPLPVSPLFLLLFFFLIYQLLVSFLSPLSTLSLSNLSTPFFYILLSLLIYLSSLKKEHFVRPLLLSSFLVALYALIQKLQLDWIEWVGIDTTVRPISTLGNPDYLSAFLSLALLYHLHSFLTKKGKERALSFLTLTFLFLSMIFTYARGGWLSFLVIFLGFASFKKAKAWLFLLSYFICLIALASSFQVKIDERQTNTWQRIKDISNLSYPSFQIRKHLFHDTLHLIRDRPLTGSGLKSFSFIFPAYRSPQLVLLAGAERVPEHPHNEILNLTAELGFPGLFLFLWISFYAFLAFFKKREIEALFFLAFFLQNLYYYPVTPVYLLFYSLLGFAPLAPPRELSYSFQPYFKKVMPFLLLLFFAIFTVSQSSLFTADFFFKKGMAYYEENNLEKSLPYLEKAQALTPQNFQYSLQLAQGYVRLAALIKKKKWQEKVLKRAESILHDLEKRYGEETHILQAQALLYSQWPHAHKKARELFLKSLALDPYNTLWRKNIALFYISQKEYTRAQFHLLKALEIDKRDGEAYSLQGVIFFLTGAKARAQAAQKKAIQISPQTYSAYIRLILLLMEEKKYNEALSWVALARLRFPQEKELLGLEQAILREMTKSLPLSSTKK